MGGSSRSGDEESVGEGFVVKLRGLPFSTQAKDVLEFLQDVSVPQGEKGVHLTEIRPGRPSGECFVEVESEDDVKEALKKDKQHMGKRYIEVFASDTQEMNWAQNTLEGGNGFSRNISDDMGVVKLRGLPFGCSKDDVIKFFDGIEVAPDGINILSDHTGRASGEAFVHFLDKEGAQLALDKDREKIGHRYIEVFISSPDEVRSYISRQDHGLSSGGGRMPSSLSLGRGYGRPTPYDRNDRYGGGGRYGRPSPMARPGPYRGDSGPAWGGSPRGLGGWPPHRPGDHCVHMRGLPFKATPQDIAYFFKPVRPMNINILFDENNRPSGEADVEFECHEDAVRAMRRDKSNMEHRYIELFLNSSSDGGSGSGGGSAGSGGGYKPHYNRNLRNMI